MSVIQLTMTREIFTRALAIASPGTDIVYHEGKLHADREWGPNFLTVNGVGRAAWDAMMAGKVILFQRTDKETGLHKYVARARAAPYTPTKFKGCYAPGYSHTHHTPLLDKVRMAA